MIVPLATGGFSRVGITKRRELPTLVRAHPLTIYDLLIGGGQGRNRTADAGLFRAALYQLSYLAVA